MHNRGTRRRRAARWAYLLAAAVILVSVVTGWARGVDEVLPGQKLWGEVSGTRDVTVALRVIDGSLLDVSAKAWKGSTLRPHFSLRGADGATVPIDDFLKHTKTGTRLRLKKLPIARGGIYFLTIAGEFGSSGGFDLNTSAKVPKKEKGVRAVTIADEPISIEFDGLAGDVVQLKVAKGKKSPLAPMILRYVEEDGTTVAIDEQKTSGKQSVLTTGRHRFEVSGADGTTGEFKFVLKIKRAKPPTERLDAAELRAAGTIRGRIVLEGDVSRDKEDPAKKARTPLTSGQSGSRVIAGEIIVSTRAGPTPGTLLDLLHEELPGVRFDVGRGLTETGPYLVHIPTLARIPNDPRLRRQTFTIASALNASPLIDFAEVNGGYAAVKTPNDARWFEQYDFRQMNLPEAWAVTTGSPNVIVAVLDTGIWTHPDLDSKVVAGYDFVSDVSDAADGNGWDSDPTDAARDFHGTHVAGTIAAATSNGHGVAGVAWNCRVLPVRVLGRTGGSWFDIAAGLRWAVGLPVSGVPNNPTPARVVNMSLGGESTSATIAQAVSQAAARGATMVAAAGNNASSVPFYPAAYSNVISVYALDSNLNWASYSNWGTKIDVGAPGGDLNAGLPGILSTYVDGGLNATYQQLQGTSSASPHIAGVAALLLSVSPSMSAATIRSTLIETAVDLGPPGFDVDYGYGMVDAGAALRSIQEVPQPTLEGLSISPASLQFRLTTTERRVYLRSTSETPVRITNITITTASNGPWLRAELDSTITPATLTVTVDQSLLGKGLFDGLLRLNTSIATDFAYIPVRVSRLEPPTIDIVRVNVLDSNRRVVASTTTSKASDWKYSFDDLPVGNFKVVAEADLDKDLELSRVDEFEGAWPLLDRPQTLTVTIDELDREDVDIPMVRLAQRFHFDGVGGGSIDGAIAVLALNAYSGAPIAGAEVSIGDDDLTTVTDVNGRALISADIDEPQTVTVAAEGYATLTRINADSQFQAFPLTPRAAPLSTRVIVNIAGLRSPADTIVVRAGDARTIVPWAGQSTQSVALDVTVTRPLAVVSAIVKDAVGAVTQHAHSSVGLAGDDDVEVGLELVAPTDGSRRRRVVISFPPAPFSAFDAMLDARMEAQFQPRKWSPIGFDRLVAGVESSIYWANYESLIPSPALRVRLSATDSLGHVVERTYPGSSILFVIPTPSAMPAPPAATSPANGQQVTADGASLTYAPTEGSDYALIEVFDEAGSPFWNIITRTTQSTVELPRIRVGGLKEGASYAWRVTTRDIENFDFNSHVTTDVVLRSLNLGVSTRSWFTTR